MDDVSHVLYQRIATLEAQVAYLYQHLQVVPPPALALVQTGVPDDILAMVRAGDTIGAIKRHRQLFGSSLVEAKHIIEDLR